MMRTDAITPPSISIAVVIFSAFSACHAMASDVSPLTFGESRSDSRRASPVPNVKGKPVELPFVYTTWKTFTTRDGLPHETIRALRVFGERVWVGTEGGLALWDSGTFKSWTVDDGLPWPVISAIDVDPRTEDVWLGTWGGGLVRLSAGRFDRFDQFTSGLAGNLVFAVVVDGDRVWAATNGGISALDTRADTWALHFGRRADADEQVATAFVKTAGDLYAQFWCGPVQRLDLASRRWTTVGMPAIAAVDTPIHRVPCHPLDAWTLQIALVDGFFWRATLMSLFRRDRAGTWEAKSLPESNAVGELIHCLTVRPGGGEAWLGTDTGLEVLADFSTDTWVTYRRCADNAGCKATVRRGGRIVTARRLNSAIPDNRVRCVAFDGEDVWVGTAHGLARGIGRNRWSGLRATSSTSTPAAGADCTDATGPAPSVGSAFQPVIGPANDPLPGEAVVIAALGPTARTMTLPGATEGLLPLSHRPDLQAIQLAIDEANARGGWRGRAPFVLHTGPEGYTRWGWITPEDDFSDYASFHGVMGIIGTLHPNGRIASAAALHAQVPVINVVQAPATIDEVINPWMFRCRGDQPRQVRLVLDHIVDSLGKRRVAVLRTVDSIGSGPLDLVTTYMRSRKSSGVKLVADVVCDPADLGPSLRTIQDAGADVVFTWCDSATSAAILGGMRKTGMKQMLIGSDRIVGPEFIKRAGENPGTVLAFYPSGAHYKREADGFARRFTERFKRKPAPDAYLSYRGTWHLLEAINTAGRNRRAVRRTLERMSRYADGEDRCGIGLKPVDARKDSRTGEYETILARLEAGAWRFTILRGP